ncbi:MAG: capsid assembly protein [Actinomycetota bacterium]
MYYEDSLDTDQPKARPANVPEKFWDPAKGEIRAEALLKAYADLEKRMSATRSPAGPQDYQIRTRHPALASDPEVNKRLHAAGFTPEQAQLVYDLAHEHVVPILDAASEQARSQAAIEHLKQHFGGDGRWSETARQLAAWGKANLDREVYDALSATPAGVKAMHRLMAAGEPGLGRAPAPNDEPASEERLKKMMQDPRYWKTRDPAFIDKVSAGFRRLYGD